MRASRKIATLSSAAAIAIALVAAIASPASAATPTVVIKSSVNPSVFSQRIVLSTTITVPGQAAATITGTADFADGATVIGSAAVVNGKASLATRALAAGAHDLTATFTATGATVSQTSAPITQVVNVASTTTVVASSRPTANYGDAGTITAAVKPVAPANAIPTGSVDFYVDGGWYWSATLDTRGKAVLALADLYPAYYPGTYAITAAYSGDVNFDVSATATALQQTLVGISAPPVTTATLNAKSQPVFAPATFSLRSANPVGCNVTITNATAAPLVLVYGTPGNWKRLPYGVIAPGASGGVGIGLSNFTGYFSAVGAANYVTIHCI